MQVTVKEPEAPATGYVVNGEFYAPGEHDVSDEVGEALKGADALEEKKRSRRGEG